MEALATHHSPLAELRPGKERRLSEILGESANCAPDFAGVKKLFAAIVEDGELSSITFSSSEISRGWIEYLNREGAVLEVQHNEEASEIVNLHEARGALVALSDQINAIECSVAPDLFRAGPNLTLLFYPPEKSDSLQFYLKISGDQESSLVTRAWITAGSRSIIVMKGSGYAEYNLYQPDDSGTFHKFRYDDRENFQSAFTISGTSPKHALCLGGENFERRIVVDDFGATIRPPYRSGEDHSISSTEYSGSILSVTRTPEDRVPSDSLLSLDHRGDANYFWDVRAGSLILKPEHYSPGPCLCCFSENFLFIQGVCWMDDNSNKSSIFDLRSSSYLTINGTQYFEEVKSPFRCGGRSILPVKFSAEDGFTPVDVTNPDAVVLLPFDRVVSLNVKDSLVALRKRETGKWILADTVDNPDPMVLYTRDAVEFSEFDGVDNVHLPCLSNDPTRILSSLVVGNKKLVFHSFDYSRMRREVLLPARAMGLDFEICGGDGVLSIDGCCLFDTIENGNGYFTVGLSGGQRWNVQCSRYGTEVVPVGIE